ncbi:MAG: sulfatase family protein [Pirellulaceae bacterium]
MMNSRSSNYCWGTRGIVRGIGLCLVLAGVCHARAAVCASDAAGTRVADKPNIVIILADDLGWGDVHCFDPAHNKVPTPHIDRLAAQGMRFTDAHASGALCSPSRYGLLTGRYSWRTPMRNHVVRGYGSPLIKAERLTLPALLQQQGYYTACVGKWHLGWNWPLRQPDGSVEEAPPGKYIQERTGEPIFERPIQEGPQTRGFNEYFGVDLPNNPPYTFIRDDRMVAAPTDRKVGQDRVHWGPEGPMAPGWQFDQILPRLVDEAEASIARRAVAGGPFFLYFALTSPHEPIAPSAPFRGKSGISDVADFIMETDDAVGRIMTALEQHGRPDNTLLVFTSDNGHCGYTGITPLQDVGHRVGGPYRGYKCDISEGGHRIPLVVRWPGTVSPDSHSDQLACLTDWMATCAELLQVTLPANAGEDSVSLLPLLRGGDTAVREDVVIHSYCADILSVRKGPWKLALCAGDGVEGRWCNEKGVPQDLPDQEALQEGRPPLQLYDLEHDPGETRNLQAEHPEIVADLLERVDKYIMQGRSTAGAPQENDVPLVRPSRPSPDR